MDEKKFFDDVRSIDELRARAQRFFEAMEMGGNPGQDVIEWTWEADGQAALVKVLGWRLQAVPRVVCMAGEWAMEYEFYASHLHYDFPVLALFLRLDDPRFVVQAPGEEGTAPLPRPTGRFQGDIILALASALLNSGYVKKSDFRFAPAIAPATSNALVRDGQA